MWAKWVFCFFPWNQHLPPLPAQPPLLSTSDLQSHQTAFFWVLSPPGAPVIPQTCPYLLCTLRARLSTNPKAFVKGRTKTPKSWKCCSHENNLIWAYRRVCPRLWCWMYSKKIKELLKCQWCALNRVTTVTGNKCILYCEFYLSLWPEQCFLMQKVAIKYCISL